MKDQDVADRAVSVGESIVKLIKYWLSQSQSKRPRDNISYDTLVKSHTDLLMTAKFHFFKHVASIFQEFLELFQTDKPMVPFLSISLEKVFGRLLKKFVSSELLEEVNTPYKLVTLDLSKKDVCLTPQLVDLLEEVNTPYKLVTLDLSKKDVCLTPQLVDLLEEVNTHCISW